MQVIFFECIRIPSLA